MKKQWIGFILVGEDSHFYKWRATNLTLTSWQILNAN